MQSDIRLSAPRGTHAPTRSGNSLQMQCNLGVYRCSSFKERDAIFRTDQLAFAENLHFSPSINEPKNEGKEKKNGFTQT
ncbi:hypothetical protein GOC72_24250 [Sinorhizobium medicae]|uniref:Uncharacterized protein n=1 Tax=Sinorhizobium medicae TaxID=110321 RepID=A0ABX4TF76_9HYPH|nr:hypothetical protein [Sinorhizobium medicae]MDX0514162.1 hypothetical protein [Sinorhizobium medicae]MDX0693245.1 hypothetical protein [Sinorhizobium medicae]MDX0724557.1 hypothetical protein [Sinorhizobium medicae]MDX0730815.1 hypothetical protein [Sinorhizobium medicae]